MKGMRGLGFVYQHKGATIWWIAFSVRGVRHRESSHSSNRADAIKLLKKRIADCASGRPLIPQIERTVLDDLLQMVIADYVANARRSLDRVQDAAIHLRGFFGRDARAVEITTDRITAYQAYRQEQRHKGRRIAAATVNYELAVLRRGFRLALRAGKVASRPEISMLHVDNARKGFFESAQYRAVLNRLPDYLKSVAKVAYTTGWRKSELLSRQWRHVDLAAGWLRLEPGETKNGEGREFPFTPDLRVVLEAQREHVRKLERVSGQIIPWVFCHPDGSPIKDFRHAWQKACRDAGVPERLVHDFRRTAVRNFERAGVPRSAAMKLSGHRTETVYRRYAICDAAMLQEAVAKLAVLHAGETKQHRSSGKVESMKGR